MLSFYLSLLSDPADKEKMTLIYEQYRQTMYAAAVEILRSSYDAEDAVHESFVRLASNLHKVDVADPKRTAAYLITIVKNVAYTHIKKKRREIPESSMGADDEESESILEKIHDKEPLPADQMQIKSTRECLLSAINRISPVYREALILFYLEDKSTKQTAAILWIAENTVSQRLSRGRAALHAVLAEEGYHAEDL